MAGKSLDKIISEHSSIIMVVPDALVKIYFNGSSVARSFVSPSTCFDYHLEKLGRKYNIKSITPVSSDIYVFIEPKA